MEYVWICIVTMVCGYWFGVISGYGTKVREQNKSQVMTVRINLEKGIFYFWDMSTNKFMLQNSDKEAGMVLVRKELRPGQTLVITEESDHEPI